MQTRYVALSMLAHAAVLAAGLQWIMPRLVVPAPALSLTLEGSPASPAARARPTLEHHGIRATHPTAISAPAATRVQRVAAAHEPATTRSGNPTPPNHLLSLVYAALARHFVYPPLARKLGWQGQVYVDVRLESDGRLHPVRILRSSGHRLLDRDAFNTLSHIGVVIPDARARLHGHSYAFKLPVTYKLVEG